MAGSFLDGLAFNAAGGTSRVTIKFDEYGGKAVELPGMQALFSDNTVQHQPLIEAIYDNEPVDDVADRNGVARVSGRVPAPGAECKCSSSGLCLLRGRTRASSLRKAYLI
jgi:hypothetical protein